MTSEEIRHIHEEVSSIQLPARFSFMPLEDDSKCVTITFSNENNVLGGQVMLGSSKINFKSIKSPGMLPTMDGPEGIHCLAAMDRYNNPMPLFNGKNIKDVSELVPFLEECQKTIDSFVDQHE